MLKPIVIDGSNVALSHGNNLVFSCKGIRICVEWFKNRGHKEIKVFVPSWRKENARSKNPIRDQDILFELEREDILVFTPSRWICEKRIICYDDRYILKFAADTDAIVVSNDNYRDIVAECIEFKKVVKEHLLMYSFINDKFMPPDDPLGRQGPTLEEFLNKDRFGQVAPLCPYGKKCTYGYKCKYRHRNDDACKLVANHSVLRKTVSAPPYLDQQVADFAANHSFNAQSFKQINYVCNKNGLDGLSAEYYTQNILETTKNLKNIHKAAVTVHKNEGFSYNDQCSKEIVQKLNIHKPLTKTSSAPVAYVNQESSKHVTSNGAKEDSVKANPLEKFPTLNLQEKSSNFDETAQKYSDVTQALTYMFCKDNLPFSYVESPGLQRLMHITSPNFKLPCRKQITELVEQRFNTLSTTLKKALSKVKYISLTCDLATLTNSMKTFLLLTAHFVDSADGNCEIENFCLTTEKTHELHTEEHIKRGFEQFCEEFEINKNRLVSVTIDENAKMVGAIKQFSDKIQRLPCMVHLLNMIVDGTLQEYRIHTGILEEINAIVVYFKNSANSRDQLRTEESTSQEEKEVLTLTQVLDTRWNYIFDMLERFTTLSVSVAKILALRAKTHENVPNMIVNSKLNIIRDLLYILRPFKQVVDEITGAKYNTSSLAIPLSNLLKQEIQQCLPLTTEGSLLQKRLFEAVTSKLTSLEYNTFLAKATILDPRFKRIHFTSSSAVANAVSEINFEIRTEHQKRRQICHKPVISTGENASHPRNSIWSRHEDILCRSSKISEDSSIAFLCPELKQYLDQPNVPRNTNPLQFWIDSRHLMSTLSEIAQKYLISPASLVASERISSILKATMPEARIRLSEDHIRERLLLFSASDKFWFP